MLDFDPYNPLPLFKLMFPSGPAGADVMQRLAPNGWRLSSVRLAIHPDRERMTKEQLEEEDRLRTSLVGKAANRLVVGSPHKSIDEIECAELLGLCFQNLLTEHELLDPEGTPRWMDTWRGTGGSLADWVNQDLGVEAYDYMDFYMGAYHIAHRTDLTPVYALIFSRLRLIGWDWYYLDESRGPDELTDEELAADRYSPETDTKALLSEIARKPYGRMVAAYLSEFGCLPKGWFPEPVGSPDPSPGWVP